MRRLVLALPLAAVLLLGAATPAFAHGATHHATHNGNCGRSTISRTHSRTAKACPLHPTHPVGAVTPPPPSGAPPSTPPDPDTEPRAICPPPPLPGQPMQGRPCRLIA